MNLISMIQDLQILEKQGVITKTQRWTYIDLFTYVNHFEELIIRKKKLTDILNMTSSNVEKLMQVLTKVGLIKKRIIVDETPERKYGNCLALQLVPPERVLGLFESYDEYMSRRCKPYIGNFQQYLYTKTNPTDLVIANIEDMNGNFIAANTFIECKSLDAEFLKALNIGDKLQFDGIPSGEERIFIHNIKNVINVTKNENNKYRSHESSGKTDKANDE